jgi:glucosamine-phosphate N-acetyltransferase
MDDVFQLLNQLTEIDYSDRNKDICWDEFIYGCSIGIVGLYNDKIVAYGSIVIENKIRGEKAGHIEDIVVDKNVRGNNVGVNLIKHLVEIGKIQNCYRITLFCDESLIHFYRKNGFEVSNILMKKYL